MSKTDRTDAQGTVMAADGILLMGLSLIVTILGTQVYYRIRGQPINNAVAGLVIGMCTGAMVFSEVWWTLFGFVSHRVIQLDSQVFYNILIPPIVFYAGFSVKKKLFFKNLVTIAIFGILGCNLTAGLLSAGIFPVLKAVDINSLVLHASHLPAPSPPGLSPPYPPLTQPLRPSTPSASRSFLAPPDSHTPSLIPHDRDIDPISHIQDLHAATPVGPPSGPPAAADAPGASPSPPSNTSLLSSALRLGTVFSPTDNLAILHYLSPNTQPVLHSLLFGEGVMNDITAVVMLMTTPEMNSVTFSSVVSHYWDFISMFSASSLVGVAAGLLSALLTKHFFSDSHHHTDREVILMTAMAVSAYVFAAATGFSGILAVFFCGITMSHYTWHSISASARVMSVHNFRVLSSVAEMFLFIYAGLDVSSKLSTHVAALRGDGNSPFLRTVVALALGLGGLILIVRALFVAIAVAIVNLWRSYKFTFREAVTMWYGGLVRGSITTALAYSYLYTPGRHAPGDEAVLLASVLVVVASTVVIGGTSEAFMRFMTLPPAQSRLIEINSLPGMAEDELSMHSTAVLSSKLHKMWRKFDRNVFQRLFGGRDTRMPNYFASVAELNQRILRVQDTSGHLPVSSILPPPRHSAAQRCPPLLASEGSTDMSDVRTVDFRDSECGSHYVYSGTPSPRASSQAHSHDHHLRTVHHVASDLLSQAAPSATSSASNQGYSYDVPELPTTSLLLQQQLAASGGGAGARAGAGGSGSGSAGDPVLEGLLFPRSHSDPHVHVSTVGAGANSGAPPAAGRRLAHSKTMHEARSVPHHDVPLRAADEARPAGHPTASCSSNGRSFNERSGSVWSTKGLANDGLSVEDGTQETAGPPRDKSCDCCSSGGSGSERIGSVEFGERRRGAVKPRWSEEVRREGADVATALHDGFAEQRPSTDRRPPAGPSAAAVRRLVGADTIVVPDVVTGVSSEMNPDLLSEYMRGSPANSYIMARQLSRVTSDAYMTTAMSGAGDNLPGPFQPPPSNATSEDVHVGADGPFSSFEDALLDLTLGGEDVPIPWDEYDEADKRAAHGSRSAMN